MYFGKPLLDVIKGNSESVKRPITEWLNYDKSTTPFSQMTDEQLKGCQNVISKRIETLKHKLSFDETVDKSAVEKRIRVEQYVNEGIELEIINRIIKSV